MPPIDPELVGETLSRHFVSLIWIDHEVSQHGVYSPDSSDCISISAFVMSIRGRWFIITAGHVLQDIRRRITTGRKITSCRIFDSWHPKALFRDSVPFDFQGAPKYVFGDEDGIDCAVISLSRMTEELLQRNGIVPLDESYWEVTPRPLDVLYVVGLPHGLKQQERKPGIAGARFCQYATVCILPAAPHQSDPDEQMPGAPRIHARLLTHELWDAGDTVSTTSIVGMSGGPIFGLKKSQSDESGHRYWLVAVQSTWRSGSRVIAGCPVRGLGDFLAQCCEADAASSWEEKGMSALLGLSRNKG